MKEKQFPWLDWLRFGAAFIVVLGHTRHLMFVKYSELESTNVLTALFYAATKLGNEAVLIFFVLSGFLVGGASIKKLRDGSFDIRSYSIDRITRIMVPLIPALLLTVIVEHILKGNINYLFVLGNLFSLQGIVVPHLPENEALWTLSYEVWFYIIAGAMVVCIKNINIAAFLILGIGIYVFTKLQPHYFMCWTIGAVAYLWRPKKSSWLLVAGGLLLLYGIIGRQIGRGSESVDIAFLQAFVPSVEMARLIFSAGFALLLQQIILIKKYSRLESVGVSLAAFSYTLYLVHFPIIHLFTRKGMHINAINIQSMTQFAIVVTTCILAALVMYWLFERNTTHIRKWLK